MTNTYEVWISISLDTACLLTPFGSALGFRVLSRAVLMILPVASFRKQPFPFPPPGTSTASSREDQEAFYVERSDVARK